MGVFDFIFGCSQANGRDREHHDRRDAHEGDTDMVALIAAALREEARRKAEGRADAYLDAA